MPGNRGAGVPAPAKRRLVLEPLERRMLLSGNVTVLVSGVDLIVTGDGDDNNIRISQDGLLYTDQFELSSPDGTTINGGVGPRVFDGIFGNIIINMGGGSEVVEIEDCTVPGEIVFNGGSGDNSLTIDPTTVNGDIHITNGVGFDYTQFFDVTVGGSITIANGIGGSFIGFNAPPGTNEIAGSVTITNGTGIDELIMIETEVLGNLTVNNGNGGALPFALPIDGEVDGSITLIEGSHIGGTVSITNWNGVDEQGFFGIQVDGSVVVNNGNGGILLDGDGALGALLVDEIPFDGSLTQIEGVLIQGDLIIKNGNGIDEQSFDEFLIGGNVLVDNGNGATGIVVTTADGGFVSGSETMIGFGEIGGNLTIKNKEGLDLQLFDELLVEGNMSIDNGNGGSETTFANTEETVEVGGNLTIINKNGQDEIYLGPLDVGGNLTISNGVGGTELLTGIIAGPHTVGGSMSVSDSTGLSALIGGFEVWGNMTINGGTLGVEALVVDSLIHGNFIFNGKGLTDSLTLEGVLINGNATVTDGKGTFNFLTETNFGFTQIDGNLVVKNAGGLLNAAINDTGVGGNVSITNGNGGELDQLRPALPAVHPGQPDHHHRQRGRRDHQPYRPHRGRQDDDQHRRR